MIVISSSISKTELRINRRSVGPDGITYNWSVLHNGDMVSHGINTQPGPFELARLAIEEASKRVNALVRPFVLRLGDELASIRPPEPATGCPYAHVLGQCEHDRPHGIDIPHFLEMNGFRFEWFA